MDGSPTEKFSTAAEVAARMPKLPSSKRKTVSTSSPDSRREVLSHASLTLGAQEWLKALGIDSSGSSTSRITLRLARQALLMRLPDRWSAHVDDKSGYTYYVNELRREASWTHPLSEILRDVLFFATEIVGCTAEEPPPAYEEMSRRVEASLKSTAEKAAKDLEDWRGPYASQVGSMPYFHNIKSGESVWEDPHCRLEHDLRVRYELFTCLLSDQLVTNIGYTSESSEGGLSSEDDSTKSSSPSTSSTCAPSYSRSPRPVLSSPRSSDEDVDAGGDQDGEEEVFWDPEDIHESYSERPSPQNHRKGWSTPCEGPSPKAAACYALAFGDDEVCAQSLSPELTQNILAAEFELEGCFEVVSASNSGSANALLDVGIFTSLISEENNIHESPMWELQRPEDTPESDVVSVSRPTETNEIEVCSSASHLSEQLAEALARAELNADLASYAVSGSQSPNAERRRKDGTATPTFGRASSPAAPRCPPHRESVLV